jgi:DNA-binding response OmpR family regulator
MLKYRGYDVSVAYEAEFALTEVQRSNPVAIVVDLHLPTINGVEFLRRLRASVCGCDIPVAVVTGDYLVDEHVITELQAMGAQLFFKPLWEEDLNKIVRDLISSAGASCDRTSVGQ